MTTAVTNQLAGRSLVSTRLFERLVIKLAADQGCDRPLAARVMDQALAFLGTSAKHRGEPLSPGRLVDPGWHVFILHTRQYREFCRQLAGRFIDHVPTGDTLVRPDEPALALRRTVAAMRAAGYAVDDDLWFGSGGADCTGCHNSCHDDPPPC